MISTFSRAKLAGRPVYGTSSVYVDSVVLHRIHKSPDDVHPFLDHECSIVHSLPSVRMHAEDNSARWTTWRHIEDKYAMRGSSRRGKRAGVIREYVWGGEHTNLL